MQNSIIKITIITTLVLLFAACSKKTTAVEADTEPRSERKEGRQPRGERPQFTDLLTKLDANNDGKLSESEAQGRMKENFSTIDADSDGFITEAEFKNAPAPPRRGKK